MILVTGGAGYVGSHCVKELLSQSRDVVVFDNLDQGVREAAPSEHFVEGDLLCSEDLQNVFDHAFPPDTPVVDDVVGTVDIEVTGSMTSGIRLEVRDDGVGLPDDFDISRPPGLGTTIVHALATSDLNGQIVMKDREGCSGASAVITVPPKQTEA